MTDFRLTFVTLGGLSTLRINRQNFASLMIQDWEKQRQANRALPAKISFSNNGQIVAEVNRKPGFMKIYAVADYIVADGMSAVIASRLLLKAALPERVASTDFFHDAAKQAEINGLSFYILGTTPENNRDACKKIKEMYPRLKIVGSHHGYFSTDEESEVVEDIRKAAPDVLWVALGVPRQIEFVVRNKEAFVGITWVKTCGGLFEHILEVHPRAPLWVQKCCLEWLHRVRCEPKRLFWRYLTTNPAAFWFLLTRTSASTK